jgi:hypothetical protein
MLFKDQCVYRTPVSAYTEDETTIVSVGYKVFVNSVAVTEMRVFRNIGSINAVINIENLITFNNDLFFAYLSNFVGSGPVYTVPSATKTGMVKLYTLTYTKATGDTVEAEIGSVTMSNVIDGKFGNYFPTSMLNQTSSKFVLLTNKYTNTGRVLISNKTYDVITFYALASCTVKMYNKAGTQVGSTQSCGANGMYVVSLNSSLWGSTLKEYTIVIDGGSGVEKVYDVFISPYIEALPYRRSGCYTEDGQQRFNLFVKHPYGGLDHIANVNINSISGSSNRQQVRVQDESYVRGGSANDFETTTQSPNKFSTSTLPVMSEGRFSASYEGYMSNVNELWVAAMSACKTGYLVSTSESVTTIIDVDIDSISATLEELENNDKIWKVSVSATQKIPFVA